MLIMLLLLPNMSFTMAAADDSNNQCAGVEVSASATDTYTENNGESFEKNINYTREKRT